MGLIHWLIDVVLHLDRHLSELLAHYHAWIYGILFLIIFAQTGIVLAAILPGDSLLFGAGALAAVDQSGTLRLPVLLVLLSVAVLCGNSLNYLVGAKLGERVAAGHFKLIRRSYLARAQQFFARHGGMAVVLSLFVPIVRTFTPFVAGAARMSWVRFQLFNICGGIGWVVLFVVGGNLFGNLPLIKNNFGIVTLLIVLASLVPLAVVMLRSEGAEH
jgi:membrane-associated protein